jgi:TRAP-type mannitol/chloroaromatic compound transport system permease small subunit
VNANRKNLYSIARLTKGIAWASLLPGLLALLSSIANVINEFYRPVVPRFQGEVSLWLQAVTAFLPASVIFDYAIYFVLLQGMAALIRQLLALEDRLKHTWKVDSLG